MRAHLFRALGRFINDIDGLVSVDEMLDVIAFDYDAILIPVILFDRCLDLGTVASLTRDRNAWLAWVAARCDFHLLATLRQNPASAFFIQNAAICVAKFEVGLIATDNEFSGIDNLATKLHAAIAVIGGRSEFVIERQLEIAHFAFFPDEEGIRFRTILLRRATRDGAVDYRPERFVTFPARQILAVKKSGFPCIGSRRKDCGTRRERDPFHRSIISF